MSFFKSFPAPTVSAGVSSVNSLEGDVILAAGTNITLTPVGNTITIDAAGGALELANDVYLTSRNDADDADVDLFKLDTTNKMIIAADRIDVKNPSDSNNAAIQINGTGHFIGLYTAYDDNTGSIDIGAVDINLYGNWVAGDETAALKFYDAFSNFYISLAAPVTLAENTVYTLPLVDGDSGDVLSTDGSGQLSFVAPAPGDLANDVYFKGRNAADDGDINLIKADASDNIQIGNADGSSSLILGDASGGDTGSVLFVNPTFVELVCGADAAPGYLEVDATDLYLINVNNAAAKMHFFAANAGNAVILKSPETLAGGTYTLTFPTTVAAGVMVSNGSGQLSISSGASGSFTTADAKTVTVVDGIITAIV
jgi:hypothetical protein